MGHYKDIPVEIFKNPTTKWVTIANSFRLFETFSIIYFMPVFFLNNFPTFKVQYGLYNGLILAGCGFLSALTAGIISDKYEQKNRKIKSQIGIFGSLIALPAVAVCTLSTGNFYLSLFCLALRQLFGELYLAPSIT